jgi:hypothetical protein
VSQADPLPRHHAALRAALLAGLAGLVTLGGCSHAGRHEPAHHHMRWPWHHVAPAPEPPVHELAVESAAPGGAPALPQSWNRNNLRVGLTALTGEGDLVLRPLAGHEWPMRLEFLVQPGAFAHLEIRGEQRVILGVPASGAALVLPVPEGVYAPGTAALSLHYGP